MKLFKLDEVKYLWPFYMDVLVHGLSSMVFPFIPFYYLGIGLSYFQIAVIISVSSAFMALFEIPTGAFADVFGRKRSVILGFCIVSITTFMVPLTTNFKVLVLLWSISGIGTTFISGAQESWVMDELNKLNRPDLKPEYFLKISSLGALGSIFAPIMGAFLVKFYAIKYLWYVYASGFCISGLLLLFFTKEKYRPKSHSIFQLVKGAYKNSKIGFTFTIRNKIFLNCMVAGMCIQLMAIGAVGLNPFLVNLGMAEYQAGYLNSALAGVAIIAPFLSRYMTKFKVPNAMSVIVLINMCLLFALLLVRPPFFMVAIAIEVIVSGLLIAGNPMFQTFINHIIPGRIRATTLSVKNMSTQLVMAVSVLVGGALLDLIGPQKVLAFGGLFGILAILFFRKVEV